ncbi:MAG: (Fe-S)-binding protein [Trichlorobacter sp.]|uniref:(Fe-S)-binding protein n=1 Tax=Trichlorobacter sp. TaxID=2911007 RepID=UPI00255F7078|nr:(Fe-S)-binding protein [Trichlorobacter sp.]MDK9718676.1 (Fe-S)-binding protein [Trichlorobacter sp.]
MQHETTVAAMSEMAASCTSCGECVRPCSFLQQQGTPLTIAEQGTTDSNLVSAYACSLCGLCDAVCPERLSPSAMLLNMRQEAVTLGLVDLKTYAPWLKYEKMGASPIFQRDLIPAGCSAVFFPGCSLPGTRPDAVRELFKRLQAIDPTTGLVLDCCGKISHDLGLTERFTSLFDRLSTRLANIGITRILTACPGCSKILRKYGKQFEVVSVYEVLVASAPLSDFQNQNRVVTIHDPCPARFDQSQQQAVRQLVKQCGYQVEELPSHGQTTRCCGQGGMVEGCVSGTVKQESRIIATEAAGRTVVSSCAACCETLSDSTPTAHIVDLLTGTEAFTTRPVSSLKRWLNRLKLRFARLT